MGILRNSAVQTCSHTEQVQPHRALLLLLLQPTLWSDQMKKWIVTLGLVASTFAVQAKDIVDTTVSAGSFKTLVTAVQAAGLVDTLKGPGPFTVFAPSDEAFAKVPKATQSAHVLRGGGRFSSARSPSARS